MRKFIAIIGFLLGLAPAMAADVTNPQINVLAKLTLGTPQSISTGVWTKILFDTVITDSGSFWSAVNHNYLPLVPGTYLVCANITVNGTFTLGIDNTIVSISKNGLTAGAGVRQGSATNSVASGANDTTLSPCAIMTFNGSSDFVEIDANVTATNPQVTGNAVLSTYFSAVRVSP